ncbi:hypothetical protein [Flavobacterium sp.]|uniref:hypothetical protein n=1 Tax=Flavobacterium sp. TaxID=239 RepID=UPI002B4AF445|nr:hypothetical protein [Flavobacterium sp.]HLF53533.1 hypothetical protein [Flavobacterium sp.]
MKPVVKNLLIAGTIAFVGFALIAAEKAINLKAIFDQMTIKPNSLPKKFKFYNPNSLGIPQTVSFAIDILLTNPTGEDFAVSGYVATLKRVNVFYQGNFLGTANVNIDEVSVLSHNTLILHDIVVEVASGNILTNLSAITNLSMNDLVFTGIIEVLGNEYEISN